MGLCERRARHGVRAGLVVLAAAILTLVVAPAALAADPGEALWSNYWNAKSPGEVANAQVVRSAKGDIFTACSVFRPSYSTYDAIIAKYRPDGTRKWVRSWSRGTDVNEMVEGVATDPDGNLIVTGWFDKNGEPDWFVLKYDRDGYLLWAKTTGGTADSDDRAVDVVVNRRGYVFVTGFVTQSTGGKNWLTVKYKPSGATVWQASYKGSDQLDDQPMAMAIDIDRNVYVTGMVGSDQENKVRSDAVTIKYAGDGTVEWVLPFNMHMEETGVDIAVRRSGVVVAVKAIDETGQYTSAYAVQYTRDGELVYSPSLNPSSTLVDQFLCAGIDGSARSVFGGFSVQEATNDSTALLMQYDAAGVSEWSVGLTAAGNALGDQFNDLFVAFDGTVWATGYVGGVAVTVSLDATGVERWSGILGGDAIAVTRKSVYVVGLLDTSLVLTRYVK